MNFFIFTSYALFSILVLLFIHLIINLLSFHRLKAINKGDTPSDPFVSLLVPARNEEAHIEMCVRSLIGQHYGRLEVLVLDDQSDDATASLVQRIRAELPPTRRDRLRLLHGEALPAGWVGKNFACHQLSQHAQGDYFFFTDADTVHAPETVRAAIACMQRLNVDLLTAESEYKLKGLGERLIMPLICFRVFTLLPLTLVSRSSAPVLAVGKGPLLCLHRIAYEASGGHMAIKDRILEDVALARAVKAAGYRIAFVDALELIYCHMYTSFTQTWAAFSRTFFSFYDCSLFGAFVILILDLSLFVVPPLILLSSLFLSFPITIIFLALGSYGLACLMRLLLAMRFTRDQPLSTLLLCLLHPISIILGSLILLNSLRWHYRKQGTGWKERYYSAKSLHQSKIS